MHNTPPPPPPPHPPSRYFRVTGSSDATLPRDEVANGMTLSSPYASTATPSDEWWADMTAFLDGAHAAGAFVNFQLIAFEALGNDEAVLSNLTAQIDHFKSHPAIVAWYLADEPGGQGIPPEDLAPKYQVRGRCIIVMVRSSLCLPARNHKP